MIQRIQTLYLLLICVISIIMLFVPFLSLPEAEVTLLGINGKLSGWLGLGLGLDIVILIITVITIFLYNNRPRQLSLTKLNFILILFFAVYILYIYPDLIIKPLFSGETSFGFAWGAYVPIASMVFIYLATKAIARDERLIKSADRLR
ncbi:MAG: DUF4293 domain-containing protein [Bacteroidetes bacterium]|nr:DUF4293 domain-containing protein [Bacteroidota bacterium]